MAVDAGRIVHCAENKASQRSGAPPRRRRAECASVSWSGRLHSPAALGRVIRLEEPSAVAADEACS